jgi:excisionase family DNA binding protein
MITFDSRASEMAKLDDYLQITEAADFLGVCRNTLRNWGRMGKIPEYRHAMNNYRLYKMEDLETLLKSTEQSLKKVVAK